MIGAERGKGGAGMAAGPLVVSRTNGRYFTVASDERRAVYLTGSHIWNNLHDGMGPGAACVDPPERLDFAAYLDFLATGVRSRLADLPERTKVLFTAHSLPERALEGDPYPDELRTSASAIAARAGLDRWYGWTLAWQSAGRTPEPWRGPDVAQVIRDLGATGRAEGVLVCPQGFVSDHLEVLYDLDIDARRVAEESGLAFARTASTNDEPSVMAALAELVRAA